MGGEVARNALIENRDDRQAYKNSAKFDRPRNLG